MSVECWIFNSYRYAAGADILNTGKVVPTARSSNKPTVLTVGGNETPDFSSGARK
jgi:hypothetical protein